MSKSTTFERLCALNTKNTLGRIIAQVTVVVMAAVGTYAGAQIASGLSGPEGSAGWLVLAGAGVGASLMCIGRYLIQKLIKPIYVTGEDFDAIEDELGGFDNALLDLFQHCNGSRPMADYDQFMDNAGSFNAPTDFTSALFYLNLQAGRSVGQQLCYDFRSVQALVEANTLLVSNETARRLEDIGAGAAEGFQLNQKVSFMDRVLKSPIRFFAALWIGATLLSSVVTALVFYSL